MAIFLQISYSQKDKNSFCMAVIFIFLAKKETQHQTCLTGLVGFIEEKLKMVYCMHKK